VHTLHQPWAPDLGASYASGWHVDAGSWGTELRHNGSDGFWSARIVLIPARGYGILMASNIFSPNAELAADELQALLWGRFPPL
jgi:CubicO group peptidase (beta-lactamase class C family)